MDTGELALQATSLALQWRLWALTWHLQVWHTKPVFSALSGSWMAGSDGSRYLGHGTGARLKTRLGLSAGAQRSRLSRGDDVEEHGPRGQDRMDHNKSNSACKPRNGACCEVEAGDQDGEHRDASNLPRIKRGLKPVPSPFQLRHSLANRLSNPRESKLK